MTLVANMAEVPLDRLLPNPWQPRLRSNPEDIQDLAASIAQMGLLQRPLVRPAADGMYQLAFGHQRVEALKLLREQGRWPGDAPVEVRELSNMDMALVALSENQKRRDLAPLEQYRAYQRALDTIPELTIQKLAISLGQDRSTLSNNLRVLALPPVVLDRVDAGDLSAHGAREFLCLMGKEHSHTDIMEEVVSEIAGAHLGSAPDWRGDTIRRLLDEKVTEKRVAQWRRLEGGSGHYGGSHGQYQPFFDVAVFIQAHGEHIHRLPHDERSGYGRRTQSLKYGSLAWTCATKEWVAWQERAKAEQPKEGKKSKQAGKADGAFQEVLADDPVARQVLKAGVSPETAALQAAEELKTAPVPEPDAPEEKQSAYRRLNEHVANFLRSHPDKKARDNLRVSGESLWASLELHKVGLTRTQVAGGIGRAVDQFEKRTRQILRSTPKGKLTPDQREALGTRAQVVHIGYSNKGHPLDDNGYHRPPPYFPDLQECLEKCTWGATYVTTYQGERPQLRCMNEEHYQEKLARGHGEFAHSLKERIEDENRYDQTLAHTLSKTIEPGLARFVAVVLVVSQEKYEFYAPKGLREFAYEPETVLKVRQSLSLPEPSNNYSLSPDQTIKALEDASDDQAREVAAQLLVWALRGKKPEMIPSAEETVAVDEK